MAKSRAELQAQLDVLAKQTPALAKEHTDDADFFSAFAGASDFIVDEAGPDDYTWVLCEIDRILDANGKLREEMTPSDDRPPTTEARPTLEGLRRYPDTQGYHHDLSKDGAVPDLDNPCTCTPACPPRCPGACGCSACSLTFAIFADEAGYARQDPWTPEEEATVIAAFQGV